MNEDDIFIKVPSAFLVRPGCSSTSYHIYAVRVKIRDEEWLIHKRYSQFLALHKYVRKHFSNLNIQSDDFPPKKALGNRGARVVQHRLQRLEAYLRLIVSRLRLEHEIKDKQRPIATSFSQENVKCKLLNCVTNKKTLICLFRPPLLHDYQSFHLYFKSREMYHLYEIERRFTLSTLEDDDDEKPDEEGLVLEQSAFFESFDLALFVAAISDSSLIFYCEIKQPDAPLTIHKKLPLDRKREKIVDLCFDLSGDNLYFLHLDGNITYAKASEIIESIVKVAPICLHDSVRAFTVNNDTRASCMTYWHSSDYYYKLLVVANDNGDVVIFNLVNNHKLIEMTFEGNIKNLRIVRDKYTYSLIISCSQSTHYRIIVEEIWKRCLDDSVYSEKDRKDYLKCFLMIHQNDSLRIINPHGPEPAQLNITEKDKQSSILYDSPNLFILTSHVNKVNSYLHVYPCFEFDYEKSTPACTHWLEGVPSTHSIIYSEKLIICSFDSKCAILSREGTDTKQLCKNTKIQEFDFPEEQVISLHKRLFEIGNPLDVFFVVTTKGIYQVSPITTCEDYFMQNYANSTCSLSIQDARRFSYMLKLDMKELLERRALTCLQEGNFKEAIGFFRAARTSRLFIVSSAINFGYFDDVFKYINCLFQTRSFEISPMVKAHFANLAVYCLVRILKNNDKKIITEKDSAQSYSNETLLRNFLQSCEFYDEKVVISLLVENHLFDLAYFCAQMRRSTAIFLNEILTLDLKYGNESSAIKSTEESDFVQYLTQSDIIHGLLASPSLIGKYIKCLVPHLHKLNSESLESLAANFDLRRPVTKLFVHKALGQLSNQLSVLTDSHEGEEIIKQKDIIDFFILIVLYIIRRKKMVYFDDRLLEFNSPKTFEPRFRETSNFDKYFITAGFGHCAFIKDGILYTWGRSDFGALGLEASASQPPNSISEPKPVEFFAKNLVIPVRLAACGAFHTLVYTDYGCFSFGSSRYGQLGLGKKMQFTHTPMLIQDFCKRDLICLAAGQFHSLAVSADNKLYTWGWGVHGQLGHGTTENLDFPREVKYFRNKKVVAAHGGYCHTVVLDSEGKVYSFGSGIFGQLGVGPQSKTTVPIPVVFLKRSIREISCNYFHTLALAEDRQKLYTWGSNPQITRNNSNHSVHDHHHEHSERIQKHAYTVPIRVDTSIVRGKIMGLSAGLDHSALITTHGEVYTWGMSAYGQLGLGCRKAFNHPTHLQSLGDVDLACIVAGAEFTIAVDESGGLWGFGRNKFNLLGAMEDNVIPVNPSHEHKGEFFQNLSLSIEGESLFLNKGDMFTMDPRAKQADTFELLPTKIRIEDSSIDSKTIELINQSMDTAMVMENELSDFVHQDPTSQREDGEKFIMNYDLITLANTIVSNRQYLDLETVLNRCLSFNNHQIAALIYEIKGDIKSSMEYQLHALSKAIINESEADRIGKCKLIFSHYILKLSHNPGDAGKAIDSFLSFANNWKLSQSKVEDIILQVFNKSPDSYLFGTIFLLYLCTEQANGKRGNHYFSNNFILKITSLTMEKIESCGNIDMSSPTIMNMFSNEDDYYIFDVIRQSIQLG